MIVLSNSNAQVLAAGQSATFNIVILHTGCGECYRQNSGSVNLTQKNAVYMLGYNCNIGGVAAGEAQIAMSLDGSPLLETTGKTVSAAAGDLQSVSGETFVKTCCCGFAGTVTLTNTGTTEINLDANPRLSVKRVA